MGTVRSGQLQRHIRQHKQLGGSGGPGVGPVFLLVFNVDAIVTRIARSTVVAVCVRRAIVPAIGVCLAAVTKVRVVGVSCGMRSRDGGGVRRGGWLAAAVACCVAVGSRWALVVALAVSGMVIMAHFWAGAVDRLRCAGTRREKRKKRRKKKKKKKKKKEEEEESCENAG